MASEIKVVVVSFQCVPTGMSPYFTICAQLQGINENSKYGEIFMDALAEAASNICNVAFLNCSIDGVSCESKWNQKQVYEYLEGKSDRLSLVDPNHNAKNLRY